MTSFEEKRTLVKFLWGHGYNEVPKLQKITGYPKTTLYKWTAQLTETGDIKLGEHTGRPRLLGPEQQKYLDKIAKKDRTATSKELTEVLNNTYPGLNIAPRTVRENLQHLGYQVTVPRAVPLLKKEAMIRRVCWARKYQRRRWNTTVFSDEATFQLFRNTLKVRYKPGEPVPTRVVVKHPFKVHVWRAFCEKGIVGFHAFTGIMNGERYREILTNHLFDQAFEVLGDNWTFQQDNDPKHTAKATRALLQARCPKVLDWPSSSPDLNPIENLWAILKKRVEKKVNSLVHAKETMSNDRFLSIIEEEWHRIDKPLCFNLATSMRGRLDLVIEQGGHTINH